MTIRRTDTVRDATMVGLSDARGPNAQIQARTGPPAGAGGQGTLLAQLTGNAGGWGVSAQGVLTANPITPDPSADANGTIGHYQLNTVAGVFLESGILDIVGTDGAVIDNPDIVITQVVQLAGDWINTAPYDDGL